MVERVIKYGLLDQVDFLIEIKRAYRRAGQSEPRNLSRQVTSLFDAAYQEIYRMGLAEEKPRTVIKEWFKFSHAIAGEHHQISGYIDRNLCVFIDQAAVGLFLKDLPVQPSTESDSSLPKKNKLPEEWLPIPCIMQRVKDKRPALVCGAHIKRKVLHVLENSCVLGKRYQKDGIDCVLCTIDDADKVCIARNRAGEFCVHEDALPALEAMIVRLQPDPEHAKAEHRGRIRHDAQALIQASLASHDQFTWTRVGKRHPNSLKSPNSR